MVLPVPEVHGSCARRFEPVRHALSDVLAAGAEVGLALAVQVDKDVVVDLWGGHADAAKTRPWAADTIVNLYSVGKAVTAVCVLRLVDAGVLDLDAPVARYWPEFAQAGKAQPWWTPGAGHGYHVNTPGFLLGEIVRRITGKTIGSYLREEIAGPAGIDFFFGVAPELDARCAEMVPQPPGPEADEFRRQYAIDLSTLSGPALMRACAYRNPRELSGIGIVNTRPGRAAEMPSTNGHGNARAVARLYSALATDGALDGVHILSPEITALASTEQVYGDDLVLERPTRFGLGFQLSQPERRLGPSPRAFGHFGAGGSLGFADPDARLAFGYAMNQGRGGWQHKHVRHLIDLIYTAL